MQTDPNPLDATAALWNGPAGHAWVASQTLLDDLFRPFEALLLDAVRSAAGGGRVLDVGCGTGSTTLAIARTLAGDGQALGVDVSAPMIACATQRAEQAASPARFILADAQTHPFEPASADLIVSRFGVMFFDDPVAAFANLRRAGRVGAVARLIVWRAAAENPFMTTAERATAALLPPLLPPLPARRPDAPGQFAFADPERVVQLMQQGGWADVALRPLDVACKLPEAELVPYLSRLGPVGLLLQQVDERTRAQAIDVLRAAFEPYVHGNEVRFNAACWCVEARVPAAV